MAASMKGKYHVAVQATKAYVVNGGLAPLILNLGTWWGWLTYIMTIPIHPRGRTPLPIEWEPLCAPDAIWLF